jgi:hypothetical protein
MTDDDRKIGTLMMCVIDAATKASDEMGIGEHPELTKATLSALLSWAANMAKESGISKKEFKNTVKGLIDAAYCTPKAPSPQEPN